MIYRGKEAENHRGSTVRYMRYDGNYRVGILLEPVNYQIVVTKEHGCEVLSTEKNIPYISQETLLTLASVATHNKFTNYEVEKIREWANNPYISEVESVEIWDGHGISDEEAEELLLKLSEKLKMEEHYAGDEDGSDV